MTKKVLMLAAKANMIQQFNHRNIKILQDLGYEVHVATNMVDFGSMSEEENERFKQWMNDNKVVAHQVDFERRMGSLKGNIRSLKQLRQIFRENDFTFIHVHSPLGSILGRLVARKFGVPVIYTAHGFHFFKGGPKTGWLFFYPLEWIFSFITETLITINNEDYVLAKEHMHAKKVVQINGIGVDVEGAWRVTDHEKQLARKKIRKELRLPTNAFLITSVGELSNRKNHKLVLEALKMMSVSERKSIYYAIAGTGENVEMLTNLADSFSFQNHFILLGYRTDIHDINYASDISVFPSLREGLGIAGLDAVIDGTYLLATNKGGVNDYLNDEENGKLFNPIDPNQLKNILNTTIALKKNENIIRKNELLKFDYKYVDHTMLHEYRKMGESKR
ncbi:glycosyltransferase [Leuconostoc mesenteroides]|uniref:glycosyltransferase n=1 Tax=Leuconostoc mesenteroides TaxID=1245 RepID=UPI003CE7AC84